MQVALLGTGKMGAAIAHRLAGAGHALALCNRTRSRAEAGNPIFELRGMRKGLDLALSVGHASDAATPASGAVREIYFAEAEFGGDEITAVIEPYLRGLR